MYAAIPVALAAQAEVPPQQNQNRWQVTVSSGQCSLRRLFTTPQEVLLSLQTVPGSGAFQLATVTTMAFRPPTGQFPASMRFHDADAEFKGLATSSPMLGAPSTLVAIRGIGGDFLNAFAAAQTLTFEFGSESIGPLPLGSAGKAVAAFRGCIADQLVEWGADASQFAPGGTEPVATVDRDHWVSDDRLRSIPFKGDRLQAWFRVSIGVDGAIDQCARVDAATAAEVEKIACKAVVGKIYLRPGRDAAGNAVRGVATFVVELYRQRGL